MKLKIIVISFLMLSSQIAVSQDFDFIQADEAIWTINSFPFGYCVHLRPFGLLGDTTINNIIYHKIYQSKDTIWNPLNLQYFCAFRQYQNEWFFVQPEDTVPYRLYDFDISVNDTVYINNL